jgi:zinc transporter ZupT
VKLPLGSFIVVGFIIQNITEDWASSPCSAGSACIRNLALLGFVEVLRLSSALWIGGFSPSPTLTVLFLAIGTGAVYEVVYEIVKLIQKDTNRQAMPMTVFSGILTGMLVLWVTGLMIK